MDLSFLGALPWQAWAAAALVCVVAVWQAPRVVAIIRATRGCDGSAERVPDDILWRSGDVFAAGLSVPIVIIGYDSRVKVYNRPAEDLSGYPFHAVIDHPLGLLLPDDEADSIAGWLDRYLREHREGDVVQMVGHRRPLVLRRPGGELVPVTATMTHFGNGHGGIQLELRPAGGG